jgi:branched-chain amino acid transport system ATP-binding protein
MTGPLELKHVAVRYGRVTALHGVDLVVPAGTVTAILGRNGAGKSSLLRAVAGAVRLSSGAVVWRGEDISHVAADRRARSGIVLVPEGRRVFPDLTVYENLRLGGFDAGSGELPDRLDATMELFPVLQERSHEPAGHLSGGQQQMLAIGRAMMSKPDLLLLDEPSLGLSPLAVAAVYEQLEALRETHITMLIVEQQVHRALNLAHDAVVLSLGEVVAQESPETLASDPRLITAYLGGERL